MTQVAVYKPIKSTISTKENKVCEVLKNPTMREITASHERVVAMALSQCGEGTTVRIKQRITIIREYDE